MQFLFCLLHINYVWYFVNILERIVYGYVQSFLIKKNISKSKKKILYKSSPQLNIMTEHNLDLAFSEFLDETNTNYRQYHLEIPANKTALLYVPVMVQCM